MIDSDKLFEKNICLYIEPAYFIIKIKNSSLTFSINKLNKKIECKLSDKIFEGGIEINGVIGIIEAQTSNYLILITKTSFVGTILRSKIFKIEELKFFPFINSNEILLNDIKFINMYHDFVKRNNLYFSDKYDLTNSLRRYLNNIQSNSSNFLLNKSK